jgi:hypothetical protein
MTIRDKPEATEPKESHINWMRNPEDEAQSNSKLLAEAKRRINERKKRDATFGKGLFFGEPDWDILLGLFVAELEKSELSISEACSLAAGVRHQTAIRLLRAMAQRDLIEDFGSSNNAVTAPIRLTQRALKLLDATMRYESFDGSNSNSIEASA